MRTRKKRNILLSVFFALAIVYLSFHALHGEQGVYALLKERYRLDHLQEELVEVAEKRVYLERRVAMMRDGSLDRDMLEEQVRRSLGSAGDDEIFLLLE